MKRLALLALVLACSPSPEPPDAGQVDVTITLDENPIVVVRGQSAAIHMTLSEQGANVPLDLSLGTLPEGLTCADVTWQPTDGADATLTVTAAADAPDAEISITVTATNEGAPAGTANGLLAISDVIGSPDTTFGQSGFAQLNLGTSVKFVGMGQQTTGRWMLAGYSGPGGTSGTQVFPLLVRLLGDGALDPNFGQRGLVQLASPDGVPIIAVQSVAFSADDRVALGFQRANDGVVVTLDADGNVLTKTQTADVPVGLAWDGDNLFIGGTQQIQYGSFSMTAPFTITAMVADGAGAALAYGQGPTGLARVVANGSGVGPDASYGSSGFVQLPTIQPELGPALDVDGTHRALVWTDLGEIARVLPNGIVDASWGSAGYAPLLGTSGATATWLHALPSGGAAVVGTLTDGDYFVSTLDASGNAAPFGTYGRTLLCQACAARAAAIDAAGTRVCVAEESQTNGPLVGCYRLAP